MAVVELPTKPLRKSLIWELQAQYYEENGMLSWNKGIVPNWITSNNYIGHEYGTCIIYTLKDLINNQQINTTEPIYIIELGSGTGKFAHLCISTILEKLYILTRIKSISLSLKKLPIKYIMTDFTSNAIYEWLQNPLLMNYVHQGILDFGLFDAHTSQSIALWHEQRKLIPNNHDIKNPLFIISNYTFDSLKADVFRIISNNNSTTINNTRNENNNESSSSSSSIESAVSHNTVYEGRLQIKSTITSSIDTTQTDNPNHTDKQVIHPDIFLHMDNTWDYNPISPENIDTYYTEDKKEGITEEIALEMNYLLDWYRKNAFLCPSITKNDQRNVSTQDDNEAPNNSINITNTPNDDIASSSTTSSSFTFPFPTGTIQCLHNLLKLGKEKGIIVYIADKGFSNPYNFRGNGNIDIHIHGSISMMVNYHAIQLWTESQGGNVLITNDDDVHIKMGIIAILPSSIPNTKFDIHTELPLLTDIFYDRLQKFGPSEFWDLQNIFPDHYHPAVVENTVLINSTSISTDNNTITNKLPIKNNFTIYRPQSTLDSYVDSDSDNETAKRPSPHSFTHSTTSTEDMAPSSASSRAVHITLRGAIALCRFSNWDPDIFYKFRDLIAARLPSLSPPRRQQIYDGINIMWLKAFPSPGSQQEYDVAFEIGRIFYLTNDYKQALKYFLESLNKTGDHSSTYFNIGMCCYHLHQYIYAKDWLTKAITYTKENNINGGNYPLAETWLQMCEEELLVESSLETNNIVFLPTTRHSPISIPSQSIENSIQNTEVDNNTNSLTSNSSSPNQLQRLILPGRSNVKLYI